MKRSSKYDRISDWVKKHKMTKRKGNIVVSRKKLYKSNNLEEAYELNQKKSNAIIGGNALAEDEQPKYADSN